MKNSKLIAISLCSMALSAGAGYWFARYTGTTSLTPQEIAAEARVLYWYDPMVPDKHFDKPGKSPFMDMELVPKYSANNLSRSSNEEMGITIDSGLRQNLGLRAEPVTQQELTTIVRAAGYIAMDEHRIYSVPVRSAGYVEKLLIKAEGDWVVAGQKIAEVFSPELIIAQDEYVSLLTSAPTKITDDLTKSVIRKLLRLGVNEKEIKEIASRKEVLERVGVYAPTQGFVRGHVMDIKLHEGARIESGQSIMTIADYDYVWQIVEIPERETSNVHVGQKATIKLVDTPDTVLTGTVDYIYPDLDSGTRSIRARISLANPEHRLRPGQYVETTLFGSPRSVLMVPSSAIIHTGLRTVVIKQDGEYFLPIEVITGQEQNNYTEVTSGLKKDEMVVASGQFLIDSEASLSGVLAKLVPEKNQAINNMEKQL